MITVGVFDSGVGGLSALRTEMPQAHFVYLADSRHSPYGERSTEFVAQRSMRVTELLRREQDIRALVVACNTATALAIDELRLAHPDLPFIGVEPALKPAAAMTLSGHIGVLATRRTVESARFARLRDRIAAEAGRPLKFTCQPCDGLADAIERGDQAAVAERAQHHLGELHRQAQGQPAVDTLVLGCTHYPFASEVLQASVGPTARLVETGAPVARRTREVLGLPRPTAVDASDSLLTLLSTGDARALAGAAGRWLGWTGVARPVTL